MKAAARQRWSDHRLALELALRAIAAELDERPRRRAAGLEAVERLRVAWGHCRADREALLELRLLAGDDLPGALVVRAALEAIEGWAAELENA